LECPIIRSAMSRKNFEYIKSHIKYSKECEENAHDAAWKVRTILEILKKNIKQFGYFETAVSVDEMMIRFFGTYKTIYSSKAYSLRFEDVGSM